MRITEYAKIIEQAETDLPTATRPQRAGMFARIIGVKNEITNALWQPGYREEATILSDRCRKILEQTYAAL